MPIEIYQNFYRNIFFMETQTQELLKCPLTVEGIKRKGLFRSQKSQYMRVKMPVLQLQRTPWMNIANIMSQRSQTFTSTYCNVPFIQSSKARQKYSVMLEVRQWFSLGKSRGGTWEGHGEGTYNTRYILFLTLGVGYMCLFMSR